MRRFLFRWVEWNLDHATQHGVTVEECEAIVRVGRFREVDGKKLKAVGRGSGGRWLQVVFAFSPDKEVFVIHARPLTDREKKRQRRHER